MCLMAAFVPHRANKYFHVTASNGIVLSSPYTPLAIVTASPNRIGSGIRNCPRCRCRLATFGALPTPSTIYRAIIMLNNHRFWEHASGPSSSSGKTLSSFHPLLARAMPLAAAPYRASGLVLWHFSDVTAGVRNVCCWGKSGSRDWGARFPFLTQAV
jgi:hypothetical protein